MGNGGLHIGPTLMYNCNKVTVHPILSERTHRSKPDTVSSSIQNEFSFSLFGNVQRLCHSVLVLFSLFITIPKCRVYNIISLCNLHNSTTNRSLAIYIELGTIRGFSVTFYDNLDLILIFWIINSMLCTYPKAHPKDLCHWSTNTP